MTQKEARAYAMTDSGNWEIVEMTDRLALYRLTFKSLTFFRVDVWRETLIATTGPEFFRRGMKMEPTLYYIGADPGTIAEPCSMTFIGRAIYNEAAR